MSNWIKIAKAWNVAQAASERVLLFTLVRIEGSSYRKIGARMLVGEAGARAGSISAGCIEADLLTRVPQLLAEPLPRLLSYDNRGDDLFALNAGCSGEIVVFVEQLIPHTSNPVSAHEQVRSSRQPLIVQTDIDPGSSTFGTRIILESGNFAENANSRLFQEQILPPLRLIVFGAQADSVSLTALAESIDMETVVVDWRSTLLAHFGEGQQTKQLRGQELAGICVDERTAVVIMSHSYEQDRAALNSLLDARPGYLGVMGPRKRTEQMLREIGRTTFGAPLYYPVGIDIGADSSAEIAISIIAEILSVFTGTSGASLTGKPTAIHAPIL